MWSFTLFSALAVNALVVAQDPQTYCYDHQCGVSENGMHLPPNIEGHACESIDCCHEYCKCFMGYGFIMNCGADRVWNGEFEKCTEPWEVSACGVTTTTTESTTKSNECTNNDCTQDGYFPEGDCEPTFCTCWDGWGWIQECMDPLIFVETTGACDWRENVPGCNPTTTTTTTTTTTSTTTTSTSTPSTSTSTTSTSTSTTSTSASTSTSTSTTSTSTTTISSTTVAPTTTPLPDPDCDLLCQGVEDNTKVSNGCCTPKFCWCYSEAWHGMTECKDIGPADNLFCKSAQDCVKPENCHSTPDCCDNSPQTTTTTTTKSTTSTSTSTTSTSTSTASTSTSTATTSTSTSTSTTSTSTSTSTSTTSTSTSTSTSASTTSTSSSTSTTSASTSTSTSTTSTSTSTSTSTTSTSTSTSTTSISTSTSTSTSASTSTTSTSTSASTTSTTTTGGGGGATTSADFSNCTTVFCKDQADGNYGECCGPKSCYCYNGSGYDEPCGDGEGYCPTDETCVANCDESTCCK